MDRAIWAERLDERLHAIWTETTAHLPGRRPGAVVRVASPAHGLDHVFASGTARADDPAPMQANSMFHIASVGKTMTAALLFQAFEDGLLPWESLDEPVSSIDALDDLWPLIPAITVTGPTLRQMLNHTSGLRDAFSDDGDVTAAENGGRPAARSLSKHLQQLRSGQGIAPQNWPAWNPSHPDNPNAGVINWFISGSRAASRLVFDPGTRFHYSDTAYMIIALLVERLTGQAYGALLDSRIFRPLSMASSFLAYSPQSPDGWATKVSDFWMGDTPVFSADHDVSWDWGGGGQISTASDLALFLRGLFQGRLFRESGTLETMSGVIEPIGMPPGCTALALGFRRLTSPGGIDMVGHAGAWSVQAFYSPDLDVTITGTFNQSMAAHPLLRTWIMDVADSFGGQG